jgi:hypothetical protein
LVNPFQVFQVEKRSRKIVSQMLWVNAKIFDLIIKETLVQFSKVVLLVISANFVLVCNLSLAFGRKQLKMTVNFLEPF